MKDRLFYTTFWRVLSWLLLSLCSFTLYANGLCPAVSPEPPSGDLTPWIFADLARVRSPWVVKPGTGKKEDVVLGAFDEVVRLENGAQALSLLFQNMNGKYPAGDYYLSYDGKGQLELEGDVRVLNRREGLQELSIHPKNDGLRFILLKTDEQDPIRNIQLIAVADQFKEKRPLFRPEIIEALKDFSVCRFESWQKPWADSGRWTDRASLKQATQGGKNAVALEFMVELANETKVDPWFCIPHRADEDYIRHFAEFLKKHLDPKRKIYVEYGAATHMYPSSEQVLYWTQLGKDAQLSEEATLCWTRAYANKSIQIFDLLSTLLNDPAKKESRLIRVQALGWGPHASETFLWNESWKKLDAVTVAFGFWQNQGLAGRAEEALEGGVKGLFATAKKELSQLPPNELVYHVHEARNRGLKLFCHEGGQLLEVDKNLDEPLRTGLSQLSASINRHPAMQDLYQELLMSWKSLDGGVFAHKGLMSSFGINGGSWGLKEHPDSEPDYSPKYRAWKAFFAAQPSALSPEARIQMGFSNLFAELPEARVFGPLMLRDMGLLRLLPPAENMNAIDQFALRKKDLFWLKQIKSPQAGALDILFSPVADGHWKELGLAFVPAHSGFLDFEIQNSFMSPTQETPLYLELDRLDFQNGSLSNSGFDQTDEKTSSLPAYWSLDSQAGFLKARQEGGFSLALKNTLKHKVTDLLAGQRTDFSWEVKLDDFENTYDFKLLLKSHSGNLILPTATGSGAKMHAELPPLSEKDPAVSVQLFTLSPYWQHYTLSWIPEEDGELNIGFLGTKKEGQDIDAGLRWVYLDLVQASGAELESGDFDPVEKSSWPLGWQPIYYSGHEQKPLIMHAPKEAYQGQSLARISHTAGLQSTLKGLKKGVPVTLSFNLRRWW